MLAADARGITDGHTMGKTHNKTEEGTQTNSE